MRLPASHETIVAKRDEDRRRRFESEVSEVIDDLERDMRASGSDGGSYRLVHKGPARREVWEEAARRFREAGYRIRWDELEGGARTVGLTPPAPGERAIPAAGRVAAVLRMYVRELAVPHSSTAYHLVADLLVHCRDAGLDFGRLVEEAREHLDQTDPVEGADA